jgi:hypothetical protein
MSGGERHGPLMPVACPPVRPAARRRHAKKCRRPAMRRRLVDPWLPSSRLSGRAGRLWANGELGGYAVPGDTDPVCGSDTVRSP